METKDVRKKLKSRGETLVETLVALLIATLALMLLPMAVISAANVNRGAEKVSTFSNEESAGGPTEETVTLTLDGASFEATVEKHEINIKDRDKKIYYYEIKPKEEEQNQG